MPEGERAGLQEERRSVSARALAGYSLALAALLVGVAFVAYRELLHYERRAISHVPEGSVFAVRVDLEQLILFEPIRKHLLPIVDRWPLGVAPAPGTTAASPGRLARLRERAGLNLGLDLRELVFASFDAGNRWVVAAGGLFPTGDLLDRIESVLAAEPGAQLLHRDGLLVLGPGELALARAADGVLLLGSSADAVQAALVPSEAHRAIGLAQQGAAAFAALSAWRGPEIAAGLGRLRGRLDYGDPFTLTLELDGVAEAESRRALERWLHIDASSVGADWGGERAVLARAGVGSASGARTTLTTTWQHGELDRACRSLAAWLEARGHDLGQ